MISPTSSRPSSSWSSTSRPRRRSACRGAAGPIASFRSACQS